MLEDKLDQAAGKVKEVAGKVTGDKGLETEGVVEGAVSKVKEVAHDVAEAANTKGNSPRRYLCR